MSEKRMRYFTGQFLQEADFVAEQDYHVDRQRRHNRQFHTPGIADGLDVTANVGSSTVTVAPGTAVDAEGRQIVLLAERDIGVNNENLRGQTIFITIAYDEETSDPATVGGGGNTRWLERPRVTAVLEAEAGSIDMEIRLARLSIDASGNVSEDLSVGVRISAGVSLGGEIEMNKLSFRRSGDAPNRWPTLHSGASSVLDLKGSLRIEPDANSTFLSFNTTSGWRFLNNASQNDTSQDVLELRPTVSGRSFRISSPDGNLTPLAVTASNSANISAVHLVPNGGRVQIGTSRVKSTLDVWGALKLNGVTTMYAEPREGRQAVVISAGYGELEVKGRVIDWPPGSGDLHIGQDHDHTRESIRIGERVGSLRLFSNNNETVRITENSVGIRQASPRESLHISKGNLVVDDGRYSGRNESGKWIRLGEMPLFPNEPGGWNIKNAFGMTVRYDSDYGFFGMQREQANRADTLIAWGDDANDNLRFIHGRTRETAPREYMRITGKGHVGIGTDTPRGQLDIATEGASGAKFLIGGHRIVLQGVNDPVAYKPSLPYIDWRQADNTRAMYLGWGQTTGRKYIQMRLENDYLLAIGGGRVGIGTNDPKGTLDVNGTIYQKGAAVHADYVFEPGYTLESIEEHAAFMWRERHLKAVPQKQTDDSGQEIVEYGSHMRGILEELEKAHIYIAQLHNTVQDQQKTIHNLVTDLKTIKMNNPV